MSPPLKYPWDLLERRGDWVLIPDVVASEVATPATLYVRRRFGKRAKIMTGTMPDGALVVLAYIPDDQSPVTKGASPEVLEDDEDDGYRDIEHLMEGEDAFPEGEPEDE